MSEDKKARRCKTCGKILVDEKLFCRRCVLEGRNTVGKIGGIALGTATTLLSASALKKNSGNKS